MSEYSDVQLFVRPISPDVKHEDIEEFFSQVGPIKELRLMPGYAFIEYETPELAQKAFSEYIDKSFQGESLQIEYAKRKPEYAKKGDFRAKITNLPEGTAWQDFKDFIRDEVRIHPTFVRIPPDEPTICYLEFGSKEDQDSAITQLNEIKYKDTELSAEQDNSPYIASASRQFNPRRRRRGGGGYRGGRGDYGGPRGDYDRPRGDYDRPRGDYGGPRGGYGGPRGGYGGPRGGYGGYRRGPPPPRDYGPPPAYDDAPGYRDYPPSGPRGSYPPRGGRGGYPPRSSGGYPPRGGSRDDYAAGDDRSFRDGPPPAPRGSDYRSSREGESGYPEEREYSRDRSPTRY
ncbi:DEKNAAC105627 [Brettanomyces naardenensis]|uniref:DEKNAAC105627 n=1 Tax=Brettanomyces naardenensis TaxID=13370 RepID=A0A448YTQ6_BRENA|nr:DEKNAAC105627 [Brettanomyces naardenensis]